MGSPCKSSDTRDVLYDSNISDFPESADETDVEGSSVEGRPTPLEESSVDFEDLEGSDLDIDLDEVNLTDFSSGSSDDYVPNTSELDTSDRESGLDSVRVRNVGLDVNTNRVPESDSDNESVPGPRPRPLRARAPSPKWTRVYPPEAEFDAPSKFLVRNSDIKNCPPRNSSPLLLL